jgi:hypothetical protein
LAVSAPGFVIFSCFEGQAFWGEGPAFWACPFSRIAKRRGGAQSSLISNGKTGNAVKRPAGITLMFAGPVRLCQGIY